MNNAFERLGKAKLVAWGIGLTLVAMGSTAAWGQSFPNKPIQLIVPYGAGGPTDTHMRVVAERASQLLGQNIVIENKPGANGTFGAAMLARAQPDGYTLSMIPASVYREPFLNKVQFDPAKFSYIINLTDYTFGLAVPANAPWQNWGDYLKDVKAHPGKISLGAAGPLATPAIVASEMADAQGISLNVVPYKGDADQANDLLGGHVDSGVLSGVASQHIKSGRLRYLAMFTAERVAQFPDVPTLRELGVDAVVESPYGIAGPEGMDPKVMAVLHDAFKAANASDASVKVLGNLNQPVNYRDSQAFRQYALDALQREEKRVAQLRAKGLVK
ncbi:tripartite tricarboxylate transporter substrate binding protein [Lampropedia puyangensis]|uniref:Tripartite tricarboxylate transporter substrate binding protein n=1 Tax=Lampropedia puyangensis TaxID=1330072 RepID=A0A4S8FBH5_9BURK|nr:tripartite tricarboxylate transporter substrate binding protein [Lampropedia puyangensis]THU05038.1 tripartite tricarboxylate transporter substrate binding protein [Lampropedia puyangensis]